MFAIKIKKINRPTSLFYVNDYINKDTFLRLLSVSKPSNATFFGTKEHGLEQLASASMCYPYVEFELVEFIEKKTTEKEETKCLSQESLNDFSFLSL